MCRRYAIVSKLAAIKTALELDQSIEGESSVINPNLGLGEIAPIIIPETRKVFQRVKFGLTGFGERLANIRAEGDRNMENSWRYTGMMGVVNGQFRRNMLSNRCAIICDAFIVGENTERPYLIFPREKKRPFLLAGIYNDYRSPLFGTLERTFAIITIFGNPLMQRAGADRTPVILSGRRQINAWLDPEHISLGVSQLLKPMDYRLFNGYPISPKIADQKNKLIHLLKPTGPTLM